MTDNQSSPQECEHGCKTECLAVTHGHGSECPNYGKGFPAPSFPAQSSPPAPVEPMATPSLEERLRTHATAPYGLLHHTTSLLNEAADTIESLKAQLLEAQERIAELERICAESYQVVGILGDEAGRFNEDDVLVKALDNLSAAKLVHADVLPFPCFDHLEQTRALLSEAEAKLAAAQKDAQRYRVLRSGVACDAQVRTRDPGIGWKPEGLDQYLDGVVAALSAQGGRKDG